MLVHLSDALAGNIYGFGTQGHSAIYEEENTYKVALECVLGSPPQPSTQKTEDIELSAPLKLNPYYLPWIMAKLLADSNIKKSPSLSQELANLEILYRNWSPTSSVLKDLKQRLVPLKSKL